MTRWSRGVVGAVSALALLVVCTASSPAPAAGLGGGGNGMLQPGNLLVSTSVFQNDPNIQVGTPLPPGCGTTSYNTPCVTAVTGGTYPYVFNNASVDGSFGVTSPIVLQQLDPFGRLVGTIAVPTGGPGQGRAADGMVTSFSSKSELALNLSTQGGSITFMGYAAAPDTTDVSNSNTPGATDPTNPVVPAYYRVVAQMSRNGKLRFTATNAYSGDNGRAAILNDAAGVYYTAGNAGNGANPEPEGIVLGAGAQLIQPSQPPLSKQSPGQPAPVGSFNVMQQLGYPTEKIAKDNNFRGLAVYHNVLYYTKGSGGNGVDSVYFVGGDGSCPTGSGLPATGATLPTSSSLTYNASEGGANNPGLTPQNMCILKGFPTASAKTATNAGDYPFGIWFANPDTLYVADEGSGDNTYASGSYTAAAASTTAGLQKWIFDAATQSWNLAYTLQSGLELGAPHTVPGYPTGLNSGPGGTGLPWAPATDGLRNLTGRVNPDGSVTLWAVTSTVSGSGDQGADPDKLVSITDNLRATSLPAREAFRTVESAASGSVLRGVSFTPGSPSFGSI